MTAIYVGQAEWRVVRGDPAAVLTTVLGSCVACCLWDPEAAVGGMNHFLLPEGRGGGLAAMSVGSTAMEVLINECLKAGATRERLRARLFGGGAVVPRLSDVGARNAAFARGFLATEGIPMVGGSLGGPSARRIRFWPATGKAQQRLVRDTSADIPPKPATPQPPDRRGAGELELF